MADGRDVHILQHKSSGRENRENTIVRLGTRTDNSLCDAPRMGPNRHGRAARRDHIGRECIRHSKRSQGFNERGFREFLQMERRYSSLVVTDAYDTRAGLGILDPSRIKRISILLPLTKNNNNNGREEVWRSQLEFITVE